MPLRTDGVYFDDVLTDPSNPEEGQIWYNTTDGQLKLFRDSTVQILIDTSNQDQISHLNITDIGTTSHADLDLHVASTSNPHQTSLSNILEGTLADLNAKVTDATLDDINDPRTPTEHATSHQPGSTDALSTGIPVTTLVGGTAEEGTSTSFARSDHQHGVGAGAPTSVGTANAEGTASTVARSDHVHSGLTREANDFNTFTEKAVPADADIVLIEDSAAAGVKKYVQVGNLPSGGGGDPTAAIAEDATTTTTTSTADVLVTGMTLTPAAGNYLVGFTGSCSSDSNGQQTNMTIYAAGVLMPSSERQIGFYRALDEAKGFACAALVTVDGTQAIEGRWRTSTGTATMYERTLTILKVA